MKKEMKLNNKLIYKLMFVLILTLSFSGCRDTDQVNQEVEEVIVSPADVTEDNNTSTDSNTIDSHDKPSEESSENIETSETENQESLEVAINIEATELDGYYSDAYNLNAKALKDTLNDIITENHGTLSYDQVYSALEDTDEDPLDSSKVVLFYKGVSVPGNEQRTSDDGDIWNREHIWAKSHGDFGTRRGPGTDLHMIRPTDASVNARRGHLDFDDSDNAFEEAPGTYVDKDSFEPRDEVKGDVARMLFYMAVRYEGENGEVELEISDRTDTFDLTDTGYGEHGKLETLLRWHIEDPVDEFEERRNNVIHEIQGNRNPFIDHPEYVARIWGDTVVVSDDNDDQQDTAVDTNENNDDSSTISITQIRQDNDGVITTISGVITYIESETTMYIQDTTGGIRVDSYGSNLNMYGYNIGRKLVVTGVLDTYKGEKEIKVDSTLDIISLNSTEEVKPTDVLVSDLLDGKYQGELIQVSDVKVLNIEQNIIEVEDKYGDTVNIYYGNTKNFEVNSISKNKFYTIIGITSWYNNIQIKLMDGYGIVEE